MNPIQTLREALEILRGAVGHADTIATADKALTALAELERTHYTAEDVADASAQGFRDGVASVTAEQEPVAWLVCSVNSDGSLSLEHAAAWKEAAHEHINDAITEHGIEDAASWVVRPAYVAAPVAQHSPEEPIELLWQVRSALALACAICDAVPNREPGHLGKLVNAQDDGTHGYRQIHDAEAALSAYLTTPTAAPVAQQPQAEAVWVNPELEHMAEEAECVSMCLNDRGVPSKDGSKPLSLWGRVQQYANPRFLEGMTTNTPIISSEHIKALAQVCRLIGNYTTAEFVHNVVGFAQVLLANKAVQEAFVKANTHLLYAAPQQAEAVPLTHVLVPVEPTQAMLDAMQSSGWMPGNYRAMLAAAPKGQP